MKRDEIRFYTAPQFFERICDLCNRSIREGMRVVSTPREFSEKGRLFYHKKCFESMKREKE